MMIDKGRNGRFTKCIFISLYSWQYLEHPIVIDEHNLEHPIVIDEHKIRSTAIVKQTFKGMTS